MQAISTERPAYLINYEHCVRNPNRHKGFGLPAGVDGKRRPAGYARMLRTMTMRDQSHSCLSSFPMRPSRRCVPSGIFMTVRRQIWGRFGFTDAFSETIIVRKTYLAIDEGQL